MRNIYMGLVFKYQYNGDAGIEEEFQPVKGVNYVDGCRSVRFRWEKAQKGALWNAQVHFSLHRSNAIGQNASSFDWLNTSQL